MRRTLSEMPDTAQENAELLRRHRPQLRYDSQEAFRAMGCASIVDNPSNQLLRDDGGVIARAGDPSHGSSLSLDLLTQLAGDKGAAKQRLDETGDVVTDAQRMQLADAYRNRVYGRVKTDGGRKWLQYWLWLYYNPKHLMGFGKHEGDWEMVQIGLDPHDEPELLTYAQHAHGERKRFDQAELHHDADGVHPVVYVAPFSHASYFEAGTHSYKGGTDNPDGGIVEALPEIEPFGPWTRWPGRWGNSRGVVRGLLKRLVRIDLGGQSPPGPAEQEQKWATPHAFHEDAKERKPRQQRRLWKAGARTYPRLLKLDANVEGQTAVVEYELDPKRARGPQRLYVTVHDETADGERIVLEEAVPIKDSRGQVELTLPTAAEHPIVRGSAFNALRQRSDVLQTGG
jgi:hypothetical protein